MPDIRYAGRAGPKWFTRHYFLGEGDRIAATAPAHGRSAPIFDLDFACVCLISLMRASRADRVGGNAPFVSFAWWIFLGLCMCAPQFRGAQT
jgi:hypothetical protein